MLLDYNNLQARHPHLFTNSGAPLKIITDPTQIKAFEERYREELSAEHLPLDWARIGVVLDDQYIVILRDLVEFPNGTLKPYVRLINRADLQGGQGVVVLPLVQGRVVLLKQFRHATRSWHFEVPRGFGTAGLSAEDNAKKELEEEVGGKIDILFDLGACHNNTGMEGNTVQLFLAHLSSISKPNEAEGIERIMLVSISEFEDMMRKARITDAFTISAYVRAKLRGLLSNWTPS